VKQYHLLAITEEQRKSLLADIEDAPTLGQVMEFLGATLIAMEGQVQNEIEDMVGYCVNTMQPAELAYLEECLDAKRRRVAHHRAKGEKLVADGFAVSGRYDLGMADRIEMEIAELEAQTKELSGADAS
jgi:hypothetical protein